MDNRISAKIIADSINKQGDRLTTYVLVFPRIVLAEFNTHRMISKNSASSRAIPFKVMLKKVMTEPFVPIAFQEDHKGMQGQVYLQGDDLVLAQAKWISAARAAAKNAQDLSEFGVTKQLCNRMLEPFLYHTVICTGSEWQNFFALRAHPDAEIHIADLAQKMLDAYNESEPKTLEPGQWHIPFGDTFDLTRLNEIIGDEIVTREDLMGQYRAHLDVLKVKIAIARCARVSYLNFEGKDDYMADLKLYHDLKMSGHMSPFEHCAQAMNATEYRHYTHTVAASRTFHPSHVTLPYIGIDADLGWCGNFKGFIQHRKQMDGENKTDSRVIKK